MNLYEPSVRTQHAYFGQQCFWGPDGQYGVIDGVIRTRVGYTGGSTKNPTYHNLNDHTETIDIEFDASKISYQVKYTNLKYFDVFILQFDRIC